MVVHFQIKPGQYADSVTLMNIAREIRTLDGITDTALVMGTPANKSLLEQVAPLDEAAASARPTDLIMMVSGAEAMMGLAFSTAEKLLSTRPAPKNTNQSSSWAVPRTVRAAHRVYPDANLAMISVPGDYAAGEAWQALQHGLHVFLFSDNVSVEDEKRLKTYAVEHHLLMMGPGAGTAILNGVGLGFANHVERGSVGIVSAAGTGLQEVSTLLAKRGIGISQAIGVGGRDLSEAVGGLMTRQAIEALQHEPQTQVIVVISKLPAPTIARQVIEQLANGEKPAVVIFMSQDEYVAPKGVYVAETLYEAAWLAADAVMKCDLSHTHTQYEKHIQSLRDKAQEIRAVIAPGRKYLRGLFSGGTLCEEAIRLWAKRVGGVWSNAPLLPEYTLSNSLKSIQHTAVDLGEEEFTVGRPHPMIDPSLRVQQLYIEAQDPETAVIQMDVVLGYNAHPDPASELASGIREAVNSGIQVIVSVVGTEGDPQNLSHQQSILETSGAVVMSSNAEASQLAAYIAGDL